MNPKSRIDKSSWKVTFPDNLKRYDRSNGCGFCGGHAVGSGEASNGKIAAIWWPNGVPVLLTSAKHKDIDVRDARGNEIAGVAGKAGKEGAILWRLDKSGALTVVDLHDPAKYTNTWAMATGGGAQVGMGDPKTKVKRWQDKKGN